MKISVLNITDCKHWVEAEFVSHSKREIPSPPALIQDAIVIRPGPRTDPFFETILKQQNNCQGLINY